MAWSPIPALDRIRASLPRPSRGTLVAAVLVLLLGLAALLRILHTPFGLPYLHHWDEPQIASTALHMMKTGDYNPHFFHYGSLSIYANLLIDILHYFYLLREEPLAFSVVPGPMSQNTIHLDDIQTTFDTGWHWGVSHPSFYLWNRRLTAAFGTATVLVAFLLGRAVAGPAAGLMAAGFLAVQDFHIAQSSLVTPDVPMSLFVVLAVFSTVIFAQGSRPRYLVLALVLCGLATATKYNGAISLIAPLAALALASRGSIPGSMDRARTTAQKPLNAGVGAQLRPVKNPSPAWLWVAVPVVPAFSFLVAMPYAVLDLPAFLSHAGYELYHYAAEGHGAVSTEAGWGHFTLQLSRLASHLGIVATVVALIGLVVLIRKRWGFLTLVFPLIYLITMAGTRVSFHRNLVVVYPFAAIALGAGVMVLLRQLGRVEKNYPWCKRYALGVAGVVLAVWYSYLVVTAFVDGWHDWTGRETRSRTIDVVNSLAEEFSNDGRGDEFRVGIAEELRIHSLDLDRLEMAYSLEPHLNLVCSATEYDVLVTANHYLGLWGHNRQAKEKAFILNAAKLQDVERITVSNAQNTSSPTRLDALSENPTVVIHLPRRQVERLPPVCHEAQRRENGRLQERSPNV